jgi:hypothetical protein
MTDRRQDITEDKIEMEGINLEKTNNGFWL